jgi:hypothetical protein
MSTAVLSDLWKEMHRTGILQKPFLFTQKLYGIKRSFSNMIYKRRMAKRNFTNLNQTPTFVNTYFRTTQQSSLNYCQILI